MPGSVQFKVKAIDQSIGELRGYAVYTSDIFELYCCMTMIALTLLYATGNKLA